MLMHKDSKIYIAGHRGLVGSAILQELQSQGYTNLVYKIHEELNLINQKAVQNFFAREKPEYVILSAARVGGIFDNINHKADFIYQNLMIECNVIHNAYLYGVKKLLFIASTAIYPKYREIIRESDLMGGKLDYSNESYAIAKIAGIKMCEAYNIQYNTNFISLVPTNLYGENDRFDLETAHVVPALIRKFYLAKLLMENRYKELLGDLKIENIADAKDYLSRFGVTECDITIWGSGNAEREFLYSGDLAEASIFIMENIDFKDLRGNESEVVNTHLNIGPNSSISIRRLSDIVKEIVGYKGNIVFDKTKPEGVLKRFTDCSKIHSLGWKHRVDLASGIKKIYNFYVNNKM